ncbi:MAG: glycoside hydrolase family 2 TIM barrel-domain containing protein, partial [Janthinobacterium lividum]
EQLTELIRQNYNHPSIMMWSVGNEVDIGANFGRSDKPQQSLGLLENLAALAKTEDPSRPTTFADCCEESTDRSPAGQQMLAGATDIMGYNRYYGWYYGTPAEFGPKLDHFHKLHPTVPMSVSEYGASGALSQHSDNPLGGPVSTFGRPHPEEYESWYHEETWKALKVRKYLFAHWVWNLFDFSSDLRQEGDAIDLNDKGLVTYDRKIRKDAFYFYRANWSAEPTLHITSSRYVDRAYPVTAVRVYSNADTVALTVNGVAIGSQPCPDRICVWPAVALKPGPNAVKVSARIGGATVDESVTWNGPDLAKGLHLDAGGLAAHVSSGGVRYGSDNFFTGGDAKQLNVRPGFGDTRKQVRKEVTGAGDLTVYDNYREGSFGYNLPLPNGRWTVTVATFEPDAELAASRSFAVTSNSGKGVTGFNPAKVSGGALKATPLSFPVEVRDGHLKLDFVAGGGPAVVAAIDVMPR